MNSRGETRLRGSVQTTFTVVMALLLVALCVLGWLLLDQDRSLSEQRVREQLDDAAGLIVRALAGLSQSAGMGAIEKGSPKVME